MTYFRVAGASEYLAITGFRIKDIKLVKKALILPGQVCRRFDISPLNYTFEVQAMSFEKVPFIVPAVFTIGPRTDDNDALLKYAKLISRYNKLSNHVKELVQGVIEGETRVLAASITMEGIFKGTEEFKQTLFKKVQSELGQFGLIIYTAKLKLLVDVCGSSYFSFPYQKTQQDEAEARMTGAIVVKVREGEIGQNVAKVDAKLKIFSKQREGEAKRQEVMVTTDVKIYENKREAEANAELTEKKKASWERETMLAHVETTKPGASAQIEVLLVDPPNITNEGAIEIPLAHSPTSSGEDASLPLEIYNPHSTADPSEDESKRLFELAQPISVAALALVLIINAPESVKHNLLFPYNAYFVSLHLSLFTSVGLCLYSIFKITRGPDFAWYQKRIIIIATGSVLISVILRLSFVPSATNLVYDGLSLLVICGSIILYLWYSRRRANNLRQTAGSEPYYRISASEV